MIELYYGTGNTAKFSSMQRMLAGLPVALRAPDRHPDVDESGASPLENARIKARAYYAILQKPVFSCDSGLYIDGLSEDEQPGVRVRHVGGRVLSDDEMITHYAGIARRLGGRCAARYQNAICLILEDGREIASMDDALSDERFYIVDAPHPRRKPGFPIDSISVHIASGEYYFDRAAPRLSSMNDGFTRFFTEALGL